MVASGHPQRQAVAAALSNADRHPHRGFGGHVPHFDDGGMVPQIGGVAPSTATMNPNTQGLIQRFSSMSPEQLQETTLRLRGSPLAGLAQKVLQQKRFMPQPAQAMGQSPMSSQPAPVPAPQVPGMAAGGTPGFAMGGMSFGQENPWWERSEARQADSGFLHSAVPGRTDHIPASPASD